MAARWAYIFLENCLDIEPNYLSVNKANEKFWRALGQERIFQCLLIPNSNR